MREEKKKNEVAEMLILIVQIGITMLVPILMCTIGGAWLDNRFNLKFLGLIGFILGTIAGFQNVYKLVKKYLKNQKSPGELKREQDEMEKSQK